MKENGKKKADARASIFTCIETLQLLYFVLKNHIFRNPLKGQKTLTDE